MAKKNGFQVGDRVAEGVICRQTDNGFYIGRAAEDYETVPDGHSEHRFGKQRAFLSLNQAPIPGDLLHRF